MRVVCLVENTQGSTDCQCEHGLSYYVESAKHKILLDTGASDLFAKNAQKLSVDLTGVDIACLSHGHYDHAGGIMTFIEINDHAPIWMQESATDAYYHKSGADERYIGIDPSISELSQVKFADRVQRIDEELSLFAGVTERYLWPAGNLELKVKKEDRFQQDEFGHEQYLIIRQAGKKVLISGCAHNGILNILNQYKVLYQEEPDAVFSGFHMRKKDGYTKEDICTIKEIASRLTEWNTKFYTGHCTGEEPYCSMKEIMGEQLMYVHSGDEVVI